MLNSEPALNLGENAMKQRIDSKSPWEFHVSPKMWAKDKEKEE